MYHAGARMKTRSIVFPDGHGESVDLNAQHRQASWLCEPSCKMMRAFSLFLCKLYNFSNSRADRSPRLSARRPKTIKHLQFGVLSPQEIIAMSELEVIDGSLYNVGGNERMPAGRGVLDRKLVSVLPKLILPP